MIYYEGIWYTRDGIITETENTGILTTFSNGQKRLTVEVENQKRWSKQILERVSNRMTLRGWGYEIDS
jgi:hypothetical protein